MTTERPRHRYLVRDDLDGCWSEHDTYEEAEASRTELDRRWPRHHLRVDDFGPNLDRLL